MKGTMSAALVAQKTMFAKFLHNFMGTTMTKVCDASNQGRGHQLMIFHAHFHLPKKQPIVQPSKND
jgi:hypothetical protein